MAHEGVLDRNLALEVVRVTEAAALSCSRFMVRGDEKAADQAAVDAMRRALNGLAISLKSLRRYDAAEETYRGALALRIEAFGARFHLEALTALLPREWEVTDIGSDTSEDWWTQLLRSPMYSQPRSLLPRRSTSPTSRAIVTASTGAADW